MAAVTAIPSPVGRWPLAGRCTVCGHTAEECVVFPRHREVRHVNGWRPCVLPNPPVEPPAEVSS